MKTEPSNSHPLKNESLRYIYGFGFTTILLLLFVLPAFAGNDSTDVIVRPGQGLNVVGLTKDPLVLNVGGQATWIPDLVYMVPMPTHMQITIPVNVSGQDPFGGAGWDSGLVPIPGNNVVSPAVVLPPPEHRPVGWNQWKYRIRIWSDGDLRRDVDPYFEVEPPRPIGYSTSWLIFTAISLMLAGGYLILRQRRKRKFA